MIRYICISIIFLLFFISLEAQIPSGYYDSASGLSGNELKSELYNIIKGHNEYPYSSSSTDVWDILKQSDKDPENNSNVILFYTGWSVNAAQEYNNGNGWNREHVWAKSHGDFGTSPGPGTDAHHLRPSDISVNAARDSRWFGYCDEPYIDEGKSTGCFLSSTEYLWQPREQVMGDVARIIFYMATRYEGENGEPDLEVIDYLPSDDYTNDPVHARLTDLLEWHKMDPVDEFERNRNNVIYSYQNNRNPFIDQPEFVDLIFNPVNEPPLIEQIVISPESPASYEEITVSSQISDPDGEINFAQIHWGYTELNLEYKANMEFNENVYHGNIEGQPVNSQISFRIMAVDNDTDTTWSQVETFRVTTLSSFNKNIHNPVILYPNPADEFIILVNHENDYKIILTSKGEKILVTRDNRIYIKQLPAGIYVLHIRNPQGQILKSSLFIKK